MEFDFEFTYPDGRPSPSYVGGFKSDSDIALICGRLYADFGSWQNIEQLSSMISATLKNRLAAIQKHGPYHTGKKWRLEYSPARDSVRMIPLETQKARTEQPPIGPPVSHNRTSNRIARIKTNENSTQLLAKAVKSVAREKGARLSELKREGMELAQRSDFLWHGLLLSFSTMGSSRGYEGLIINPRLYRLVTFDALLSLTDDQRLPVLKAALRTGKVRMPDQKAEWLEVNFVRIQGMGGPSRARQVLESCQGREAKIRFLKSFKGIGDKYARNLMMDSYHPDFRQSIAVDERIKSVSEHLMLTFNTYEEEEDFYLGVAQEAGIEGWELDRLIYNFRQDILHSLDGAAKP